MLWSLKTFVSRNTEYNSFVTAFMKGESEEQWVRWLPDHSTTYTEAIAQRPFVVFEIKTVIYNLHNYSYISILTNRSSRCTTGSCLSLVWPTHCNVTNAVLMEASTRWLITKWQNDHPYNWILDDIFQSPYHFQNSVWSRVLESLCLLRVVRSSDPLLTL